MLRLFWRSFSVFVFVFGFGVFFFRSINIDCNYVAWNPYHFTGKFYTLESAFLIDHLASKLLRVPYPILKITRGRIGGQRHNSEAMHHWHLIRDIKSRINHGDDAEIGMWLLPEGISSVHGCQVQWQMTGWDEGRGLSAQDLPPITATCNTFRLPWETTSRCEDLLDQPFSHFSSHFVW